MRRFVFLQLRRGGGRLLAAGIAIALGSAFVAAALLGSDIIKATAYQAVSMNFGEASVVVDVDTMVLTEANLAALEEVDGVTAVSPVGQLSFLLESGDLADYVWGATTARDARLEATQPTEGRLPENAGEIAIGASNAQRLGLKLGETVTATSHEVWTASTDGTEELAPQLRRDVTIVGLLPEPPMFNFDAPNAVVTADLATDLLEAQQSDLVYWNALVALDDGVSAEAVVTRISEDLQFHHLNAITVEERAHETVKEFSGDTDILTGFVLSFAGIALVVAAIVIANTFQVLVAQRAQLLALLRCVGATRRQVRRSVVLEAAVVGVVASTIGLALGALLAQSALWVVASLDLPVPIPATIAPTAGTIIWPIATGSLVTVLAALAPARLATRVAPLAALRPLELTPVRRSGRVRLALALTSFIIGTALLGLAVTASVAGGASDPTLFVAVGLLGGAMSFTGILIGAVYVVPLAARLLGRLAARWGGVPGKVAAANSVRNPRRTTATATALLIGTTLVTMMATGAATARGSIDTLMNDNYPVDIAVRAAYGTMNGLSAAQVLAVNQAEGVADQAPIDFATATMSSAANDPWTDFTLYTATPADLDRIARGGSMPDLEPGTFAAPSWIGMAEGTTVSLTEGDVTIELTAVRSPNNMSWIAKEDMARLGVTPVVSELWLALDQDANPRDVALTLRDTFSELSATVGDTPPELQGAAVERAGYEQIIDTMLAVLVGLLGVAVLIALVGVANTLSLSVLERRRENATLRAIGLRRAQLRQMLAIEGVVIALVGAALGAVLGVAYGWAGSATILGASGGLTLDVPWRDLGLVLVIAVIAGLLASALPSRTATRTPPVAALAVD